LVIEWQTSAKRPSPVANLGPTSEPMYSMKLSGTPAQGVGAWNEWRREHPDVCLLDVRILHPNVPLFPPYVFGILVLPQRNKTAVPKVGISRPFYELELTDELGLQPPTFGHLGCRQSCTPSAGLLLGQVRERTLLNLQRFDLLE
jgi:hypothetical protein